MSRNLFLFAYFACPVAAALLGRSLPANRLLPVLLGVLLLVFAVHRRSLLRLQRKDVHLRSLIGAEESLVQTLLELRQEAEDGVLSTTEQSVRLLGLHRSWAGLGRGGPETGAFEAILDELRREAGFPEMALLRLENSHRELVGSWATGVSGTHHRRVRWGLAGLGGALADVIRHPRIVRSEDAQTQPLVLLNGEVPNGFAEHRSHLVLPLLSPLPRQECFERRYLYRPDCPGFQSLPHSAETPPRGQSNCLQCRHYPVHGLLVVTDRDSGRVLQERDRLVAEALSYSLAAVIGHAAQLRAAADAEEFRDRILDAMSSGLLTTDGTGRVVFANRRAHEWIGLGAELMGEPIEDFVEVLSSPRALKATLREGMEAMNLDGCLHGVDARGVRTKRSVRLNLAPYRLQGSGGRGAVCVLTDHSGVQAMEDQIRHLDTLAAIGRFASSLAHEIRNPLAGIGAGVHYMRRHDDFPPALAENLSVIDGEIQRLNGIIGNLLTVARPAEMTLSHIDVRQLAARCIASLSVWAQERGVRLSLHGEEGHGAYLDGDKIHQVLLNLIKNAVEASASGSEVRVAVRASQPTDGGTQQELAQSRGVTILVEDDGPGIPSADLPRLFEPFFTTKSEGTGLGLFVCHNFAQRHGGILRVDSAPGVGTCFVLVLPYAPAPMLQGVRDENASAVGR